MAGSGKRKKQKQRQRRWVRVRASNSKPKTFRVFEAGCDKFPIGLVKQAVKAEKRGLRRDFIGADIRRVNLNQLLGKLKLRKPANLQLVFGDAIDALKRLPAESQHVVFGSYFVSNLYHPDTLAKHGSNVTPVFFREAKRALKPGGRLVLVQDKADVQVVRQVAAETGFGFHHIVIPEGKLKKSVAWAIRQRSTPQKRSEQVSYYTKDWGLPTYEIQGLIREGTIRSVEDYARPTIMLLRKPRKGEKKIQSITSLSVETGMAGLTPQEQRIVEEIIEMRP